MDRLLRDISDVSMQKGVVEKTHHLLVEPGNCGSSSYLQCVQKAPYACAWERENLCVGFGIPYERLSVTLGE